MKREDEPQRGSPSRSRLVHLPLPCTTTPRYSYSCRRAPKSPEGSHGRPGAAHPSPPCRKRLRTLPKGGIHFLAASRPLAARADQQEIRRTLATVQHLVQLERPAHLLFAAPAQIFLAASMNVWRWSVCRSRIDRRQLECCQVDICRVACWPAGERCAEAVLLARRSFDSLVWAIIEDVAGGTCDVGLFGHVLHLGKVALGAYGGILVVGHLGRRQHLGQVRNGLVWRHHMQRIHPRATRLGQFDAWFCRSQRKVGAVGRQAVGMNCQRQV